MAGGVATGILGSGTAMTLIVAGLAASGAIGTALGLGGAAGRRCRLRRRFGCLRIGLDGDAVGFAAFCCFVGFVVLQLVG